MSINLKTHEWAQKNKFPSFYYPDITSTNDVAKVEFPKLNESFAVYIADHQSQGRGRFDRSWQNLSAGEILLSTWCFRWSQPPQPVFPALVGLALYDTLNNLRPDLPLRLKAPNDIYLDNGKMAGLLIEVSQQGNNCDVYIGLGMNVMDRPEIDIPTTALSHFIGIDDEKWHEFCVQLHLNFVEALVQGESSKINADYQDRLKLAINEGLPESEQIEAVTEQCDLVTKTGQISWKDL